MASTGFLEHFGGLPDPRMDRQKRHSLMEVLFIAICAVICGGQSFVDMDFGKAKLDWFKHTGEWRSLAGIACVESARRTRDAESVERRYFITSLTSISKIARSIRCHWNVENKLHWVLDVDFDEDSCRVRVDHAPENFALVRQIAHNLIKQESSKNVSVRRKIKKAGWDSDFLARIVAGV